jgi:hypothetical protein
MPMSREARDELSRRQAALSGITKNPLWAEQVAEWNRKVARIEKQILLIAKSPAGANQRQLDYLRGCIDILRWQATMPDAAERSLIRFLRSQGIEIEQEEEDEIHV